MPGLDAEELLFNRLLAEGTQLIQQGHKWESVLEVCPAHRRQELREDLEDTQSLLDFFNPREKA